MITSGCERMGCILRAVIECNLMVGRSKPKGSVIPELWSPIDKIQLPVFDHRCYQFTRWRAFLQRNLDSDVFLEGRSAVHCKDLCGDIRSRTKFHGFLAHTCAAGCWSSWSLLAVSDEWPRKTLRKCARQSNELGCFSNMKKLNVPLGISCLVQSMLVCGNLNIHDYCQLGPQICAC